MHRCRCEVVLSWRSTKGGHVLAVGTDAGGTRDVPVRVVHDEGERQETDKGDTHGRDVRRAAGWTHWGSVGSYGGMKVTRVAGGGKQEGERRSFSHNVCHPTHKTKHTASSDLWADSLATEHHVMEV